MLKLLPYHRARILAALILFAILQLSVIKVISKPACHCDNEPVRQSESPGSEQVLRDPQCEEQDSTPEWERKWNFTGFDNETGTEDGRFIIPNYVHFIKFSHDTFSFVHMVCVLAALRNQRPERLFIHTDVAQFRGNNWQHLLDTPGFKEVLVINRVTLPTEVFGQPINSEWAVYHGGDVARLAIMRQYGGIYVDSDSYLIRSLDDLRRFEFVAAWRPGRAMMNQVVLAHKDARVLKEWQEGYRDYKPDKWYYNAGRQPANVLQQRPYLIHSVPDLLGTYDMRPKIYLKSWPEWRLYYSCHLMTRWMTSFRGVSYPTPLQPQHVLRFNNTFREMVNEVFDLSRSNAS